MTCQKCGGHGYVVKYSATYWENGRAICDPYEVDCDCPETVNAKLAEAEAVAA